MLVNSASELGCLLHHGTLNQYTVTLDPTGVEGSSPLKMNCAQVHVKCKEGVVTCII